MKSHDTLKRLLHFTKPYKGTIALATFCSAVNKICDIVPEILIGISIDVVVNQQHSLVARTGIIDPYNQLAFVGLLTALFWILESVFEYVYGILWRGFAQRVQNDLRVQSYAQLMKSDVAYFESKTTGGMLSILNEDIQQLEHFLSEGPNSVVQLLVNIVVMGALFVYLSPMLAICALLPIPFIIWIAYYFQDHLADRFAILRENAGALSSHIAHRLHGFITIRSYATEDYEKRALMEESCRFQKAQMAAYTLQAAYIPTIRMAIMVGFISTLLLGGILALKGTLPLNWYAALVFLTQRFLWPFTGITTLTTLYQQSMASARRIFTLLQAPSTIRDGTQVLVDKTKMDIAFRNVTFGYGKQPIINHLSLTIPEKTTVAFVGATGSGKSTLIKLLLRFYDISEGAITLGNANIKDLTFEALRTSISLVSQDIYLIDGTIAENIAYGTFNARMDDIENAAQQAQADEFIQQLPLGYDTLVLEGGKNLSGGQRQRIAIARALLKKAPVLIFDEATSAVDNETEAALQSTFAHLAHHHTIIIIAHRLSTVRSADTIHVLDKGAIVESGNHEELLQKQGAYARLWNLQVCKSE